MGGDTIRLKTNYKPMNNKRRYDTAKNRKDDIEDPYVIGKPGTFRCNNCGAPTFPYKQDELGDIVVSCSDPTCILHVNNANNINVRLKKLLNEQMLSSRYYVNKIGDPYGRDYNIWRKARYQIP